MEYNEKYNEWHSREKLCNNNCLNLNQKKRLLATVFVVSTFAHIFIVLFVYAFSLFLRQ